VITAGNHDAGARLEAPSELLNSLNVTVVGTVSVAMNKVTIDLRKFLVPMKDRAGNIEAIVLASSLSSTVGCAVIDRGG
jgi:hypothetical protein